MLNSIIKTYMQVWQLLEHLKQLNFDFFLELSRGDPSRAATSGLPRNSKVCQISNA